MDHAAEAYGPAKCKMPSACIQPGSAHGLKNPAEAQGLVR